MAMVDVTKLENDVLVPKKQYQDNAVIRLQ